MSVVMFLFGFFGGAAACFLLMKKTGTLSEDKMTQRNKEQLDEMFKRFKERIEDFEKRSEENFYTEKEKLERFDENMKMFLEMGSKMSKEANSLTQAMKSDNRASGSWGEIVLERVLEASGLRKGEEYVVQQSTTPGKPDATVFLPEEKLIFIDSKTSLSSWMGFLNSQLDEEKQDFLNDFKLSTKAHIKGLAERKYSDNERSPDYTLMFIPVESCYSLMFCEDGALWDLAWKNNIMPVSPSTLLAALKVINSFYVIDRQNKNTNEILRLCLTMRDKFIGLFEDLGRVQKTLEGAFARIDGKGGILGTFDKLEELGIKTDKQLPDTSLR